MKVTVGGVEINPVAYRKNIAYVMQDDALLATATAREALRFSAVMRSQDSDTLTSSEELDSRVEKLLTQLGLTSCADLLIGGPLIKGISGGQKKRVSVGVEIIAGPSVSCQHSLTVFKVSFLFSCYFWMSRHLVSTLSLLSI